MALSATAVVILHQGGSDKKIRCCHGWFKKIFHKGVHTVELRFATGSKVVDERLVHFMGTMTVTPTMEGAMASMMAGITLVRSFIRNHRRE